MDLIGLVSGKKVALEKLRKRVISCRRCPRLV
jgi:hypothetical protein